MKAVITTLAAVLVLGLVIVISIMYSGMLNIAASEHHSDMVSWILTQTRESSIEKQAATIEVPALGGQQQIINGFRSYREMCAICHTPPGAQDSPIARGLNPPAPNLADSSRERSDAEIFWVIKHGIRMTGMPAWGVTHGDDELWDIVAFVKTLPNLTAGQYRELDRTTEAGHSHAGGGHDTGNMADHANGHDEGGHMHDQGTAQTADHHPQASTPAARADDHHADGHSHGEHSH